MAEHIWLTRLMLDTIHAELILEHGGTIGIRAGGEGLIDAALARPRQRFAYVPESDIAELAASYLFGLVKNHGYLDGNKRVGFAAAATFLVMNGRTLNAPETEAYDLVIGLAEGRHSETDAAAWLRTNSAPTTE